MNKLILSTTIGFDYYSLIMYLCTTINPWPSAVLLYCISAIGTLLRLHSSPTDLPISFSRILVRVVIF